MNEIIIFILLIIMVAIILGSVNKKSEQYSLVKHEKNNRNSNNNTSASSEHFFSGYYYPPIIQRTGVQVLETMHLIGTSKSLDTVKGRYDFLLEIIGTLWKVRFHPRYLSDIQESIDQYKSIFYERVLQDYELAILLKPDEFDLANFYCNALLGAFKRAFEEQHEQIKLLKKDDAKLRRKEKIKKLLEFTKQELNNRCAGASSFDVVMAELETIEKLIIIDDGSLYRSFILEDGPTEPTSQIFSIKTRETLNTESEFILNPGSTFELTLLGADNAVAKQIQSILLDEAVWNYEKKQQIIPLFAEYNLRVKEIEIYKQKYRQVYFDKIEELKNASVEWKSAGKLDREDLLEDFREVAIKEIYEKANCDLVTLFECEPQDITIDDALIKEYGFNNIQTYLNYAGKIDKIRIIPNDNYYRPQFEKLVELGLAIRGSSIPLEEILSTLTLKDLNELANDPEKKFRKKNQAIEYILTIPDIEEKIGSKVSFRELFKLKPLPKKFASINLQEVSKAWHYTDVVVGLLINTYMQAKHAVRILKEKDYVIGYSVQYWGMKENMCPCAQRFMYKKFPKSSPPKIPYHVGCTCSLRQEFSFT